VSHEVKRRKSAGAVKKVKKVGNSWKRVGSALTPY
jgi:hypothetical protein